ncbi:hypothetical protein EGW08_005420 [Elysia chlorotica]|uniref:non-specific serine/threonine protein kinase n=1 Tax=Elysia chlorotica TaxID=188477 RepID=A0A433TZ26_ELYCH|nr:hypothetical protein EGW08_005420 [Elysia chlorotica]
MIWLGWPLMVLWIKAPSCDSSNIFSAILVQRKLHREAMASDEENITLNLAMDYFEFFDLHIEKILGRGKTGEVVLAVHDVYPGINRAVKRFSLNEEDLQKRNISLERAKKLFYHELEILRELDHPNVIRGSNGIVCPGYLAIAMDYCPYGTLADHLKKMDTGLIDKCFAGVVAGVRYIHSLRIVHGDIKLQNVFIDTKQQAILGDFGLSYKLPEDVRYVTTTGGTMGYYAPEVLRKIKSVDPFKCDNYAVGVVLRCMVQRRRPDYTSNYLEEIKSIKIEDKFRYFLLALLRTDPFRRSTMAEVERTLIDFSAERYALEISRTRLARPRLVKERRHGYQYMVTIIVSRVSPLDYGKSVYCEVRPRWLQPGSPSWSP